MAGFWAPCKAEVLLTDEFTVTALAEASGQDLSPVPDSRGDVESSSSPETMFLFLESQGYETIW